MCSEVGNSGSVARGTHSAFHATSGQHNTHTPGEKKQAPQMLETVMHECQLCNYVIMPSTSTAQGSQHGGPHACAAAPVGRTTVGQPRHQSSRTE